MRHFRADAVFAFANLLGASQGLFEGIQTGADSPPPEPPFTAADILLDKAWRALLLKTQKTQGLDVCNGFDLPASADMCREIIRNLKERKPYPISKIERQCRELARRIEAELADHVFLYVDRQTAGFYAKPFEKWDKTCSRY